MPVRVHEERGREKKLRRNDNEVSRCSKSYQLNWGDGSAGRVLTMQESWVPKLDHVKPAGLEVTFPNAGEVETGSSLGLAGQAAKANWQAPGPSETR